MIDIHHNDTTWLNESTLSHMEDRHRVERGRALGNTITFDDATGSNNPWTTVLTFSKRSGAIIKEDYCFGRAGRGVTVSK